MLGVIALLYLFGRADEKAAAPSPLPSPSTNTSISIKTVPPPPPAVTTTAQPPETAYVIASRLNVRTGPSTSAEPMIQLSRGLQLTVLARENGWAQVRAGKYTGWVTEAFLQSKPTEQPPTLLLTKSPTPEVAYVDADRLNVRSGPGTSYQQVWTLKANERVTIVERSNAWAKIKGDRYEGWVHGGYLTAKPAPAKVVSAPTATKMSASQVRQILIQRSIGLYSGRCPCPYNTMKNGRRCGGNSAYSRPGGASPLCYPGDVSDRMVANFLARQ